MNCIRPKCEFSKTFHRCCMSSNCWRLWRTGEVTRQAMQMDANERKEEERLKRVQDAKDKIAIREGRRRYRAVGGAPAPAPVPDPVPCPAPQPSAPALSPEYLQMQQVQLQHMNEMRQFMQMLNGAIPFTPLQPTPCYASQPSPVLWHLQLNLCGKKRIDPPSGRLWMLTMQIRTVLILVKKAVPRTWQTSKQSRPAIGKTQKNW